MGIMVYSLLWVMQDFVHQPYDTSKESQVEAILERLKLQWPGDPEQQETVCWGLQA